MLGHNLISEETHTWTRLFLY